MKFLLSILLLLLTFCGSQAQQPYTLTQLLQQAAVNYPLVKAKDALYRAAEYRLRAADQERLPNLTIADQYQMSTSNGLEGSYFSNEGTAISTSGGVHGQNSYQPFSGSFTTLMVDWDAFDFGKVRADRSLAAAQLELARSDYANEIFQLQLKIADAYLAYVISRKLVAVQEENLLRAQSFQQYVISHARSGLLPGVDSSSANAEVAKAQLNLLQGQQYVALQQNRLGQLSGLLVDSIRVDSSFLISLPQLGLVTDSIGAHPLLDIARRQVAVQQKQLDIVKRSPLPTIHLLGIGWGRGSGIDRITKSNTGVDGFGYQAVNYMAAVAVKWNITSLIKNKYPYRSAAQQLEASGYQLEEEASVLQREASDAQLEYRFALEQAKLAPVQYQAAEDAYRRSKARYEAGLASLTELQQAYYLLNRADVDQAVSVNNVWRAVVKHAAATGNLSELTSQLPK